MKSEKVIISNSGDNFPQALEAVEMYTKSADLGRKPALHLRLLAEETISMVESMTGQFTAYFWVDGKGDVHTIHLEGSAKLGASEREDLLSVAKSGGNILAQGIMGKIKDLIEIGSLSAKEADQHTILDYGLVLPTDMNAAMSPGMMLGVTEQFWSLQSYRENVRVHDDPEEVRELLNELERSIVANLATDVQVGILEGKLKMMVVYKEMA